MATATETALVGQERIAYGMGRNGKPLPVWVERRANLLEAYNAGRRDAGRKLVGSDLQGVPEAEPTAGSRAHEGDEPDDEDALDELAHEVEDGIEEPPIEDTEELLTMRQAKRHARQLGRRGEDLPDEWREHGALRKAHAAGRRDAEPWRHPFLG